MKDNYHLRLANGADPPDFNYDEKPNVQKNTFPNENFPELDDRPKWRSYIETQLLLEKMRKDYIRFH